MAHGVQRDVAALRLLYEQLFVQMLLVLPIISAVVLLCHRLVNGHRTATPQVAITIQVRSCTALVAYRRRKEQTRRTPLLSGCSCYAT